MNDQVRQYPFRVAGKQRIFCWSFYRPTICLSSYYKNKFGTLNYVPFNTRNRQTQERQRVARVKRVLESFSFLNLISSIMSQYSNIIPQSLESRAVDGALLQIVNKLLQKTI